MLCGPVACGSPGLLPLIFPRSLPQFLSVASVAPSSHLILRCPLLLLPSIFPSIRDFSSESSVHIRGPKYWSFSFSISPSSEYSGLIFFKIDWLDPLAVQESKASILCLPAFFRVQLSQLYMTTGKTIALTLQTFVSRVMSLLFNTLFRFVTIRSDFRAQEAEICHCFHLCPFYWP